MGRKSLTMPNKHYPRVKILLELRLQNQNSGWGADGKSVMTAPGQAASLNTGNLTGAGLGLGGIAYGADAVMGGTEPAEVKDMGGAGVLRPETDQKSVDQKLIDDTNRDAIAQYGSKDGPTVDDAKTFVA